MDIPPSCGCRGEIIADYLPIGPPLALPAGPVLEGSSDPLAALGGIELAVWPLTGLEPGETRLPTTTSDCTPIDVLVVRVLVPSTLSLIFTASGTLGVVALAFAPFMVSTRTQLEMGKPH